MHGHDEIAKALERHACRREQGIPTVTVLSGPPLASVRAWRAFVAERGRSSAEARFSDEAAIAEVWIRRVARERDLVALSAAHAKERVRPAARPAIASALRGAPHELALLLDEALGAADGGADAVARWVLGWAVQRDARDERDLAGDLVAWWRGREPSIGSLLAAIDRLIPSGAAPALLHVAPVAPAAPVPTNGAAERIDEAVRAARALVDLAAAVPALPVAIAAEPALVAAVLDATPDVRWTAVLREGVIPVAPSGVASRVGAPDSVESTQEVVSRLAARSRSESAARELHEHFEQALRAMREAAASTSVEEKARSAAEAFLRAALEAAPETRGFFEPNVRVSVRGFGAGWAEVDLYAERGRIAVEVDGWHHFRAPESYRRDRRKDVALQERGILVMRFLAEDVVAKLEDILDAIRDALDRRRASGKLGGAQSP